MAPHITKQLLDGLRVALELGCGEVALRVPILGTHTGGLVAMKGQLLKEGAVADVLWHRWRVASNVDITKGLGSEEEWQHLLACSLILAVRHTMQRQSELPLDQ